ncbi:hypothetical protein [Acinetobacter sp.]|uniref:hypothetical protein n=1 Tax=Acinetobacter sp. TaxID=472 RepID=UPI00388EFE8F
MDFDQAQATIKTHAKQFIGEEIVSAIASDYGGSDKDNDVCLSLEAISKPLKPAKVEKIKFIEEGEAGVFELRLYEYLGIKFGIEYLDDEAPTQGGGTCYIAKRDYETLTNKGQP